MTTDEKIDLILNRLDTMENRFDTMENRFDTMENRFDTMENRFDTMENRFDTMENRFDTMENRLDTMQTSIDMLQGNVSDFREEQLSFRAYIENVIEKKLDVMVEAQKTYEEQIPPMRELKYDVEFLKSDVDNMKLYLKSKAS